MKNFERILRRAIRKLNRKMGKYKNFFVKDEITGLYIPSKEHDKYLKHLKIVIKSMGECNSYVKPKKESIDNYSYWH